MDEVEGVTEKVAVKPFAGEAGKLTRWVFEPTGVLTHPEWETALSVAFIPLIVAAVP
jgi:hypothetical protein